MIERRFTSSRREFLQAGTAAMIGAELGNSRALASGMAQGSRLPNLQAASVKALVFDTFGTVVDWRTSVTREVEDLARRKRLKMDEAKFADVWRAGSTPGRPRSSTSSRPTAPSRKRSPRRSSTSTRSGTGISPAGGRTTWRSTSWTDASAHRARWTTTSSQT